MDYFAEDKKNKVKWVVLGQNEKFDLYLDNGNEPFY